VSLDAGASHRKFCDSLGLPFPLLVDEGGKVARDWGVFLDAYGGIARRSVFVVDPKGVVTYVDAEYDVKTSAGMDKLFAALGPVDDRETKSVDALFSVDEYRDDLKALSSDEFEGRGIGSRGEKKTVDFLAAQLKSAGFSPGHGPSFVQPVPLVSMTMAQPPKLELGGKALRFLDDFVLFTHRQPASSTEQKVAADGDLVFVGYGCTAPEEKWDDFKGVDVAGKVVVVLVNDPPLADGRFGGKAMTYYGRWTYKFEEAARRHAAGALLVHETEPAAYPWQVVRNSWGGEQFDFGREDGGASRCAFEGWVTREVALDLFQRAGLDFDAAKKSAARDDFKPIALHAKDAKAPNDAALPCHCVIEQKVTPIVSHNVVGILPGRDPRTSNDFVVLSAHWDHFGLDPKLDGDQIFNGAVDNASGCAGILALARAIARGPRPARSVMALFVTGEERGLLGSQYYCDHPLVPLERTRALVNLDSIDVWGPTKDVAVVGKGQTTLEDVLAEVAKTRGRVLVPDPEPEKGFYYRSDQLSFARKGVPALYVDPGVDFVGKPAGWGEEMRKRFTAERYHKPSDEFDPAWDLSGAVQDLVLLDEVVERVLGDDAPPRWKEGSEFHRSTRRGADEATK
jgi:Zn-dependent M28 family amino/carboxypeptidase